MHREDECTDATIDATSAQESQMEDARDLERHRGTGNKIETKLMGTYYLYT